MKGNWNVVLGMGLLVLGAAAEAKSVTVPVQMTVLRFNGMGGYTRQPIKAELTVGIDTQGAGGFQAYTAEEQEYFAEDDASCSLRIFGANGRMRSVDCKTEQQTSMSVDYAGVRHPEFKLNKVTFSREAAEQLQLAITGQTDGSLNQFEIAPRGVGEKVIGTTLLVSEFLVMTVGTFAVNPTAGVITAAMLTELNLRGQLPDLLNGKGLYNSSYFAKDTAIFVAAPQTIQP